MEQLGLPFTEDLEVKAKRLFNELMVIRKKYYPQSQWALTWRTFHGLLLQGYDIVIKDTADFDDWEVLLK